MIVIVAGNDKSIVIVGVGAPSTNDIVKPTPTSARMCIEIMTSGHDCHPIPTSSTSQHYY